MKLILSSVFCIFSETFLYTLPLVHTSQKFTLNNHTHTHTHTSIPLCLACPDRIAGGLQCKQFTELSYFSLPRYGSLTPALYFFLITQSAINNYIA